MTLKEFYDVINKFGIDFGDLMTDFCDWDTANSIGNILDDDSYDCFTSIVDDHPDELTYYNCYVDSDNGRLCIYLDLDNIDSLIDTYYPD